MKVARLKFSERHLKHLKQMKEKYKINPSSYVRKLIEDDIERNNAPFENLKS